MQTVVASMEGAAAMGVVFVILVRYTNMLSFEKNNNNNDNDNEFLEKIVRGNKIYEILEKKKKKKKKKNRACFWLWVLVKM